MKTRWGLSKQKSRLEEIESVNIAANVVDLGTITYDKAYISQGLAAEWKDWVRSEYQRAETQVKTFLLEWAQKSYDLNRPDDPNVSLQPGQARQKDHKIVRMFETYLDAVHNLQPWNSDWDMQIDDGDGMDTGSDGGGSDDGDGMDID
ncbi:hypothetical protein COH20_006409 [Aspergillus flavus]|uniref:Uncharacterized protein n=1 Tax=Aspergillus flavus TaxID=5059 RepID=A0AB74CT59_ASPFL|nr:hypothetical protein COH20_006409 [Aspergillus flavus]RAQ80514.1 hypothetical protein COH21_004819 [Aspergillus flavus]RMZ48435.1 hypothetical protein CA14_009420 [Aspergillus flavus]